MRPCCEREDEYDTLVMEDQKDGGQSSLAAAALVTSLNSYHVRKISIGLIRLYYVQGHSMTNITSLFNK